MVLEAAGSAAPVVVRAHFLEAGRAVGRSCRLLFSSETLGEEETAAMVSDFQQAGRLVGACTRPARFRRPAFPIGAKSSARHNRPARTAV